MLTNFNVSIHRLLRIHIFIIIHYVRCRERPNNKVTAGFSTQYWRFLSSLPLGYYHNRGICFIESTTVPETVPLLYYILPRLSLAHHSPSPIAAYYYYYYYYQHPPPPPQQHQQAAEGRGAEVAASKVVVVRYRRDGDLLNKFDVKRCGGEI